MVYGCFGGDESELFAASLPNAGVRHMAIPMQLHLLSVFELRVYEQSTCNFALLECGLCSFVLLLTDCKG